MKEEEEEECLLKKNEEGGGEGGRPWRATRCLSPYGITHRCHILFTCYPAEQALFASIFRQNRAL